MDAITTRDCARLVRDLRAAGLSEWTIAGILKAASRVFAFAGRHLDWHGANPIAGMEAGERPRTGGTPARRIFEGDELAQTLAASHEPYRTLFHLAAVTGARESELLGLTWGDVDLADTEAAAVSFGFQVDRKGQRVALKTDESRRTVELPRSLAGVLLEHRARSPRTAPAAFVFATRTGRAISQRNTIRELRRAMTAARDADGRPTFPALFERDARGELAVDKDTGRWVPARRVVRGQVPTFHGFRHTAASVAIADGDVEEVSWQLGHKSSVVTRSVYRHEVKSAERTAHRRAKMEERYGALGAATVGANVGAAMGAKDRGGPRQPDRAATGEVVDLRLKSRSAR